MPNLKNSFVRAARHNPISAAALIFVGIFFAVALFPSSIASQNPVKLNLRQRLQGPNKLNLFGTDSGGMDIFARVIYGARTTVGVVVVVLVIAVSIGLTVGTISGFNGGNVDILLMRLVDVFIAVPPLILAIAISTALGRGLTQTMIAVGMSWWPGYARMVRSQVLSVKHAEYVQAAQALGASQPRIAVVHVLRNCFDPILVKITMDVGYIALTTAGLSFLGLGAMPPTPEWGRMVSEGREFLLDSWWVSTFPGAALFIVAVSFNLVGILVRDWLDPSAVDLQ